MILEVTWIKTKEGFKEASSKVISLNNPPVNHSPLVNVILDSMTDAGMLKGA